MPRTALYRHFDASGALLYVGISDDLARRDRSHAEASPWHGQVRRTETEWLNSREHAQALERVAIIFEKPVHNVRGAVDHIESLDALHTSAALVESLEAFAVASGLSPSTVTRRAVENSRLYRRLKSGKGCTLAVAERIKVYIAAHTPAQQGVS